MIPKTEPAENIPQSLPLSAVSMDSIVKDLRSLEKRYIASKEKAQNQLNDTQSKVQILEIENSRYKKELEDMKLKIEKLEKENSKLKSDLEESDSDKRLYHKQYQENGKEVRKLKTENESLEAKIKLLQSSESTGTKKRKRIPSSSSIDKLPGSNVHSRTGERKSPKLPETTKSKPIVEKERKNVSYSSSDDEMEYEIEEILDFREKRLSEVAFFGLIVTIF